MAEEQADWLAETQRLGERLTPSIMERVDSKYLTPKERAEKINALIELASEETGEKHTRWDLLCFSVEFIAQFAIAYFSHDRLLLSATRLVGRWLYNMHYFHAEEVYGPPLEEGKK